MKFGTGKFIALILGLALPFSNLAQTSYTVSAADPSPMNYCEGASITVTYTLTNIVTTDGNDVYLELSDPGGTFPATPVVLKHDYYNSAATNPNSIQGFIPNTITAGVYKVRVTGNAFSCTASGCTMSYDPNPGNISLSPNPVATISSSSGTPYVCYAGSITLNASVTYGGLNTPTYMYDWDGLGPTSNSTKMFPWVASVPPIPHSVIVTETTSGCVSASASFDVLNDGILAAHVSSSNPVSYSADDNPLHLGGGPSASGGLFINWTDYIYQWTPSTALNSSTYADPEVDLLQLHSPQLYTLTVTDEYGCNATASIQVIPVNIVLDVTKTKPTNYSITYPGATGGTISGLISGTVNSIEYLYPKFQGIANPVVTINFDQNQTGVKPIIIEFQYDQNRNITPNTIQADLLPSNAQAGMMVLDNGFYSINANHINFYSDRQKPETSSFSTNLVNGIAFDMAAHQFSVTIPASMVGSYTGFLEITDVTTSQTMPQIQLTLQSSSNVLTWAPQGGIPPAGLYKFHLELSSGIGAPSKFDGQFVVE